MIAIEWKPESRTLRLFGVCSGLFLALLGAWVFFRHSIVMISLSESAARNLGVGLWIAGAVMFVLAVVWARGLWPIYIGMNVVAFPVGMVVSHVILFVVYYFIFMPIGLVFRLIGRDALHRELEPAAKTYWTDHESHPPAKRYFRQF
ncbi:MAG: hypothetical protein JXA11_05910 [Phycisphaerae bacterium]|nr:hypothetical protein [Phycisphaerae bacterium]